MNWAGISFIKLVLFLALHMTTFYEWRIIFAPSRLCPEGLQLSSWMLKLLNILNTRLTFFPAVRLLDRFFISVPIFVSGQKSSREFISVCFMSQCLTYSFKLLFSLNFTIFLSVPFIFLPFNLSSLLEVTTNESRALLPLCWVSWVDSSQLVYTSVLLTSHLCHYPFLIIFPSCI